MPEQHADDELRITGTLAQHAEVRYQPGAEMTAMLVLQLETGLGLPFRAVQMLGANPGMHVAAQAKCQLLKRGARVVVHCKGLRVRSDHGRAELAAMDVRAVLPLSSLSRQRAAA